MTNFIIISDEWDEPILHLAKQFNKYAKTDELKKVTFTVDRIFKFLTDDKSPLQYQAAELLKHVRALNPELIPEYTSTLVDAKLRRHLLSSKEFVFPDHQKFPFQQTQKMYEPNSDEDEDIIIVGDDDDDSDDAVEQESIVDMLMSISLVELIKEYGFLNLEKISFDKIESEIKKCACGDGELDKNDSGQLWRCKECHTVYHENCAKIVAIFESQCRICDAEYIHKNEDENEENTS